MYSPNFRIPGPSKRQLSYDGGCLYPSERKNREEERQDQELGERVDRLKQKMWAIIAMSRGKEESEDSTDSDADTASTSDPATPQEEELQLQ